MENHRIVFVCLTPYQLFIANSYAEKLKMEMVNSLIYCIFVNGRNELIIDSKKSNFDNYWEVPNLFNTIFNRFWKRLFYGGHLFKFSKLRSVLNRYTDLIVFNDTEPVSWKLIMETKKMNPKNNVILIEEGTGVYNLISNKKNDMVSYLRSFVMMLTGNPIKYYPIGMTKEINAIIVREPKKMPLEKITNRCLIKQSIGGIFSEESINNFIDLIDVNDEINTIKKFDNKSIIFIGQPIIDSNTEINFLNRIFKVIPQDFKIIIKPHPRDDIDKYNLLSKEFKNIQVIRGKLSLLPFECLLKKMPSTILMTYSSSAAINSGYIIPKIRVCYLFRILYDYLKSINIEIDIKELNKIEQLINSESIIVKDYKDIILFIDINKGKNPDKNDESVMASKKLDIFEGSDIEYFSSLNTIRNLDD